jgi:probable rRNA maturation factor
MILNRQRRVRVPLRRLEEFAARARKLLRISPDGVSVCLVTNAAMTRWNLAYRGKRGPTDVLSFRCDEAADESETLLARANAPAQREQPRKSQSKPRASGRPLVSRGSYLGDIAIAPAMAQRNARRLGRTLDSEMRILILHGLLHLMGYDHETDEGQMERRERRLRRVLRLV